MKIEPHSIIEGLSGGIAASLVLGALAATRNRIRNLILRFKIRRSVKSFSTGANLHGVTIGVSNRTGTAFIVRDLAIVTSQLVIRLMPTGNVTTCFDDPSEQPSRKQLRALKKGKIKSVERPPVLELRHWNKPLSVEGFIEVSPFTTHEFILANQLIQSVQGEIKSIKLTLEYRSPSNEVKMLLISSKSLNYPLSHSIEGVKNRLKPQTP